MKRQKSQSSQAESISAWKAVLLCPIIVAAFSLARQGPATLEWLARHGVEYDEIYFGKPYAHLYIDDNALRFTGWDALDLGALPEHRETAQARARQNGAPE